MPSRLPQTILLSTVTFGGGNHYAPYTGAFFTGVLYELHLMFIFDSLLYAAVLVAAVSYAHTLRSGSDL